MREQSEVSSAAPDGADMTPRGRYIAAITVARDKSREAAEIADAAMELALKDWGATDNRVLRGLAHDVSDTAVRSSGAAINALMTALAA